MKVGPVTKVNKINKTTSKKFDCDVMPENYNVIVIILIYSQLGANQRPDSGRIVCKTCISINSKVLSYKN